MLRLTGALGQNLVLACVVVLGISACAAAWDRPEPEPGGGADHRSAGTEQEDAIDSGDRAAEPVQIYASEAWYRVRPEPEQTWRGVLQPKSPDRGPASRDALRFELITQREALAVYAANAEAVLEPFVGRQVLITGKLVDLSEEGFGNELWIASIAILDPNASEE